MKRQLFTLIILLACTALYASSTPTAFVLRLTQSTA